MNFVQTFCYNILSHDFFTYIAVHINLEALKQITIYSTHLPQDSSEVLRHHYLNRSILPSYNHPMSNLRSLGPRIPIPTGEINFLFCRTSGPPPSDHPAPVSLGVKSTFCIAKEAGAWGCLKMTQSRLAPKLWVSGAKPLLSVYAFVPRKVTALLVVLCVQCNRSINWLHKLLSKNSRNCGSSVLLWILHCNVVGKRRTPEVR